VTGSDFWYRVYGLNIQSNFRLLGLPVSTAVVDADIRFHVKEVFLDSYVNEQVYRLDLSSADGLKKFTPMKALHAEFTYFKITYTQGIEFTIHSTGTEVWVNWPDPLGFEKVLSYITGPILGFALRLKGTICLHASVIAIDQYAIALMAPSGGGKSTIAAALAIRGYPVLSDDMLVLHDKSDKQIAQPGCRGIRLCDDSAEILFGEQKTQVRWIPHGDKRLLELPQGKCRFASKPLPLLAIYTRLSREEPDAPVFRVITGSNALVSLLANTYPSHYYRFPSYVRATELRQLRNIAQQVSLCEIRCKQGLKFLPDFCDALLEDVKYQSHIATEADS